MTIPIVANVAHSAEETFEAVAAGLGVALVSEGNAQLYKQHSVVCLPVTDIGPANLQSPGAATTTVTYFAA